MSASVESLSEHAQYLHLMIGENFHVYTREDAIRELRLTYDGLGCGEANKAFDELLSSGLLRAQIEITSTDGTIHRSGTYRLV